MLIYEETSKRNAMSTVGIKDLKLHLGRYVSRAAQGETITVTERGTPVAMLVPLPPERVAIEALKRTGRIRGQGVKPLDLKAERRNPLPSDSARALQRPDRATVRRQRDQHCHRRTPPPNRGC